MPTCRVLAQTGAAGATRVRETASVRSLLSRWGVFDEPQTRRNAKWGLSLVAVCVLSACSQPDPVDPGDVTIALVATSTATNGWAVNYPKQRKTFLIGDRVWVFYSDGNQAMARTTTDGETFTEPFPIRTGAVFGHRIGWDFDGEHLHYAYCDATPGADLFYRRGTPRENGTIDWSADEQLVLDVPVATNVMYPDVVVDDERRPWIAYMIFEGGFETPPQDQVVTRSDETDGSWSTSDGFPVILVDDSRGDFPHTTGVALPGGKTYWVYNLDGERRYRGRLFDGATWHPEEVITDEESRYGLFNTVADGEVIHLVYGGAQKFYKRRSADGAWGAEFEVDCFGSGHTSISLLGDGRVEVAWLDDTGELRARDVGGSEPAGPVLRILDVDALGGPSETELGINLNGLVDGRGPVRTALTTTVRSPSGSEIWLATRNR